MATTTPRTNDDEDAELAALIERDPVEGGRRLVETLARRHKIQIELRDPKRMIPGTLGHAWAGRRLVVIPPFRSRAKAPETLAVALHEFGHVLATQHCPRTAPHNQPLDGICLQCEVLAWRQGLSLWAFDREMFKLLQGALGENMRRLGARAPAETIAAARALMQPATLAASLAQRRRFKDATARQAAVRVSLRASAATLGQFPCAVTGCRQRSAELDAQGDPICLGHALDAEIASQRRRRAAFTTGVTQHV